MDRVLLRLRAVLAGRKWIIWVALAFVLLVAWWVTVSMLPHHVLNTFLQYEEKANGTREFPHGVREPR